MFNNKFVMVIVLAYYCLCSCSHQKTKDIPPSLCVRNDSIVISITPDVPYDLSIRIKEEDFELGKLSKSTSYYLLDLVRKCKDKRNVALTAVKNDNQIPIRIKLGEDIDTMVNYLIKPYYDQDFVASITGLCAPLISKFSNPSQSIELKKWLFHKNTYLEDEQLFTFTGLVNQLSRSKTTVYITNSSIPIIHSFAGLKYDVKSNMPGDYFVLFAGKSSKDIKDFVAEVVANNFELCTTTSSSPMNCYRAANSNGYMCISLIAIKKDWSYNIHPLGLVAVDNIVLGKDEDNLSSFTLPNDIKVMLPSDKPEIYGSCHVTQASGGGNGIECNVSFHIFHTGDIKSVTVKRTKKLCYDSWTHKVENRVINVKDVSNPYSFTMMLHLEDGDNYIPVIIEDNHGNKTEFELNEKASFRRIDSPSINIDNNVNIYD